MLPWQATHRQAQQGWLCIVKLEEPAQVRSRQLGHLMGEERENGVAVQDKAMLGLTIEAAAAGGPPRR